VAGPLNCAAVIPCLNEQATISEVVHGVRRHVDTVFVIDDGSTDGTTARARAAGARVIRHGERRGKGAALQTGCQAACREGHRYALVMDGDGQHSPDDIPKFLVCAEQTSAALVVGNRMHDLRTMPHVRRIVNWWMSRQLSAIAGQTLPDTQCGFRLMRLDAWSQLPITSARFEVESEILLAFSLAGHRPVFVPIRVIYGAEQSKINPIKDTLRWFRWLRRARKRGA
jgi:glycosyltransferase involved in cell wall biosynthesis